MRIVNCEQRTDAWWEARRGIPTASSFNKIVKADGSRATKATRDLYLYKCAASRLTGIREESYTSPAMKVGVEREDFSRWVYAMEREVLVDEVGICISDCGRWGASPDGIVGDNGIIEIKNVIGSTLVAYNLGGKLPSGKIQQVQGQLFVAEREWCDFIAYSPKLPVFIVRVEPDHGFIAKLEKELIEFCEELDEICERRLKIGG